MYKYIKQVGLLLITVLSLVSSVPLTGQAEETGKKIVTSFYPMYAITSEVVGDLQEVQMINSGQGIHGFEPSANDIAGIYDADIFVYHSNTLESWTKNLETNMKDRGIKVIQASQGLELKKVPGLEDVKAEGDKDQANLYDPHSWLDPLEAAREAEKIGQAMAEIDPDNADTYKANAKAFSDKAQALVDKYQAIFEQKENKVFVTQHTAFYYLAERFGLKQLGVSGITSQAEPSAKQIQEVMKFVQKYKVDTIFIEPNVSDKAAKVISDNTGVEMVTLSPLESDPQNDASFLDNLDGQLQILSDYMK